VRRRDAGGYSLTGGGDDDVVVVQAVVLGRPNGGVRRGCRGPSCWDLKARKIVSFSESFFYFSP